MNMIEFIGCIFTLFIMFIANAGGLGGGGVIIPTVLAFYRFNTKNAIALSNVSICVSGLIRYFMNWKKKHPLKGFGTLVDYNYATLMLPLVIVGSVIGVIINIMIPEIIIVICLTIVVAYLFAITT